MQVRPATLHAAADISSISALALVRGMAERNGRGQVERASELRQLLVGACVGSGVA